MLSGTQQSRQSQQSQQSLQSLQSVQSRQSLQSQQPQQSLQSRQSQQSRQTLQSLTPLLAMYGAIAHFVRMNFAGRCGQYTIGFRGIAAICSRTRCIRHCRAYLVALTLLPLGTKNTLVSLPGTDSTHLTIAKNTTATQHWELYTKMGM